MESRNSVVLVGRLTNDPKLSFTPSKTAVCSFGIAVNRSLKQADGSFTDELDGFFDVEVFGDVATAIGNQVKKGSMVTVAGSLRQEKFTPRGSSYEVSKVKVRARTVAQVVLPPRSDAGNGHAPVDQVAQPQPA